MYIHKKEGASVEDEDRPLQTIQEEESSSLPEATGQNTTHLTMPRSSQASTLIKKLSLPGLCRRPLIKKLSFFYMYMYRVYF